MGIRVTSGLISLVAAGAGVGGAIANATLAIPMPVGNPPQGGVRMVIKRIAWWSGIGINAQLLIGYADRTLAGALFRQVLPTIAMLPNLNDEWQDPPLAGNTRQGFMIDTTATTGSLGDIYVECPTAGIGAAPANVFVVIEAEEL